MSDADKERIEEARAFNAQAVEVTPLELVRICWPKMPGVNYEADFVDTGDVLDDSRPVNVGASSVRSNSDADSDVPSDDPWIDKNRRKFDEKKHVMGDDGFPIKTDGGYFKKVPIIERVKEAVFAKVQIVDEDTAVQIIDTDQAADTWTTFAGLLARKAVGKKAEFQVSPEGFDERESVRTGFAELFKLTGVPRGTKILVMIAGLSIWGIRVFWPKSKPKEKQNEPVNDNSDNGSAPKVASTEQVKPVVVAGQDNIGGLD